MKSNLKQIEMWAIVMNIVLGLWLMISPSVFAMDGAAANNNYVTGPLIMSFAVIALWEVNRQVIKANITAGTWVIIALFIFPCYGAALISNIITAVLAIVFSLFRQKTRQQFGGGWKSLFEDDPLHISDAESRR